MFQILVYQLLIINNVLLPFTQADTFTIYHGSSYNGSFNTRHTRHGYLVGGLARVKYYLDRNRDMSGFILAGNFIRLPYSKNYDRLMVEKKLLDRLKPAVMTFGHNEFKLNDKNYELLLKDKKFPVVSTNIILRNTTESHTINKTRVVVMSYVPEEFENLPLASGKVIKDMIDTLNDQINSYKKNNPSKEFVFVASGCAGYEIAEAIALYVKDVNVIISGCSRTMLWNDGEPPEGIKKEHPYPVVMNNMVGKEVLLVHTYGSTRFLGKLVLNIDAQGKIQSYIGNMIYFSEDTPEDEDTKDILKYLDETELAHSRVYLNGSCAKSECKLGNVIADAFVDFKSRTHKGNYWTDTPIALVAARNIRRSIEVMGDNSVITMQHLDPVFGNHQRLVTVEVTGDNLRKTISQYIAKGTAENGMFLQVSGLYIRYDRFHQPKRRLFTLLVRCSECYIPMYHDMKMKRKYMVVTTQDVYAGILGHDYFANNSKLIKKEAMTDYQALWEYLKKTKYIRNFPDERIAFGIRSSAEITGKKVDVLFAAGLLLMLLN